MDLVKVRFQSIDYNFPKKALFFGMYLFGEDNPLLFYFTILQSDEDKLVEYANSQKKIIKKQNKDVQIRDNIVIACIKFSHLIPLKKEYWENPSCEIPTIERANAFTRAINYKDMYEVLVVPSRNKDKKAVFSAAYAFSKGNKKDIEMFMRTSDYPVSPEAKNAALYNIHSYYSYDMSDGEIVELDRTLRSN